MNKPTFAIIGAGSGGIAMTAHLLSQGYKVNLFNRSKERIATIKKNGTIKSYGEIKGTFQPEIITTNIEKAISGVNVIFVVVPAFAHKDIAELCFPHLKDSQIVILNPGRTFGAIEFAQILKNKRKFLNIIVAESQTLLHTCRMSKEDTVNVLAIKKRIALATLNSNQIQKVIKLINKPLPQFVPAKNILETGLNNVGAIFHPTPILLNIGWIETPRTKFKYYYEAITPTVAKFLEQIDKERIQLAKAMGVKTISARQWLYRVYGARGKTLHEAIQNNTYYQTIDAPNTIHHRYIYEDIPTGLVPLASLGEWLKINTPITNLIIDLACKICQKNFRKEGRTIKNLKIQNFLEKHKYKT